MTKSTLLRYTDIRFGDEALKLIATANQIVEQYEAQGLTLTLRQLYYQFVARGLLPNSDRSYSRLGRAVSDGRVAGLISWTTIEDRTRFLRGLEHFDNPGAALRHVRKNYRRDLWEDQPFRPEVWIEKDALIGVIEGICGMLRVDFFASRGYNSQSDQWRAGQRFASYVTKGQRPIVFHLGDHDPSGIDMTRDNRDRLSLFAGVPIQVVRLALNMPQVDKYNPPPNPAKVTDSRAQGYIAEYGEYSWELDALEPTVLRDLISESVLKIRDESLWDAALGREADDLHALDTMIEELGEG